jgi:hypothetical protein
MRSRLLVALMFLAGAVRGADTPEAAKVGPAADGSSSNTRP